MTAAGGAGTPPSSPNTSTAADQELGLGSLISKATDEGNFPLLAAGVVTMAVFVVLVNRFFWKRLYRLAEERICA